MDRDKKEPESSSRLETIAFKAQAEISKVLYDPSLGIFKPWQFEGYASSPVTLKTTYEELKILWNEEARFRQGFEASSDTIAIPNLFAKIGGIHKDICEYEKDIELFLSSEKMFFSPKLPFVDKSPESPCIGYSRNGLLQPKAGSALMNFISKNGALNVDSLVSSHFFEIISSNKQLQITMAQKLLQLLESDLLLKTRSEETTLRTLHMLLSLDKSLIGLLENFDYPFDVPKIVLYIGREANVSFEDCAAISFFYLCGFDILVLTPSGHNDIEIYMNSYYFDTHRLKERNPDLDYTDLKYKCNTRGKKAKSHVASFFKK
ncbi:YceG [Peptoclostridium acidaminophilum DSM 3953]|uniref:YceG n=1 Tax=Peptoclostridium acidaminophilum DSM 3953 TaxID=1286171 RepID=W8TG36_PEPAC|nr:YceG family protein [Peptoclostridium acidaminophilum]AHM56793.1 YceG [Peptoclostridium acidaminophilum DSM 3953]